MSSDPPPPQPKVKDTNNQKGDRHQEGEGGGVDRQIDRKNADGGRPKSTESGPRVLGSPSADLIFLLDAHCLCIESNITAKKTALIPNWRRAGAAAHFH